MFPQIFGKYVLERELASGGMARVYLATLRGAVGFEKRLVVKQIRPELALDEAFVKRFVEEAKIAVELSHPNIVPVYELGVEQGIYYIAMELCEGLTLTEILLETGPLDAAEGAHLGIEICRALDYAHRRGGIVHRDVTPRNVLLDEEGAVRLIDFGIAAPVAAGDDQRIEVFGSPGHMPPEQIRGERLTAATDVFAVGALLIEAWTGRPPFRRGSFEASAEALAEPLPSLTEGRPELEPIAEIVTQAVALEVAHRPQDAETLARRLRDFARQFDSGDVAKRVGERVRRARHRAPGSLPWPPADSEPLTPAASPQAQPWGRALRTPATPPMPPLTPPGASPITRTFAARGDLVEWTRKLASVPPGPEDATPAAVAAPSATDAAGSLSESEPPRSPAPLRPPADDEPATRALPRSNAPAAPERRVFPWGWAASGLAVAALAVVSLRAETPPPMPTVASRASSAVASPAVPVMPLVAAAPSSAPSAIGDVRPLIAAPSTAPVRASLPGKSVASVSSGERPSADLKLTADPPATVIVVGGSQSRTLVTPVRALSLPPGVYSVTFRSATFGDPVAARVELAPGSTRSVHADFRAAVPKVVVR